MSLNTDLRNIKNTLIKRRGTIETITGTIETISSNIAKDKQKLDSIERVNQIVQATAIQIQQKVEVNIDSIINRLLESVNNITDNEYTFRFKFIPARGKTGVKLQLYNHGNINEILEDSGGVANIIAIGLRIACICIQPRVPRLLVLDEPLKGALSTNFKDLFFELLVELSEQLNFQIVMVHQGDTYTIDKTTNIKL